MAAASELIDEHVALWRQRGWVLVPELVPADVIDSAHSELWSVFPPADVFESQPDDDRVRAFWQRQDPDLYFGDVEPDGPAFRPEQLLGMREFPFPATPNLNRLPLHPNVLGFARAAMGASDLRLYLAQAWAKYAGVTNYEQPLHRDVNHSLAPQRIEQGWWQMEGFIYLHDIDSAADGPTCLVPATTTAGARVVRDRSPRCHLDQPRTRSPARGRVHHDQLGRGGSEGLLRHGRSG